MTQHTKHIDTMPPIRPAQSASAAREGHMYLGEVTLAELDQGSGVFDEATGRELTTLEMVRSIEEARGSHGVYIHWDEISPEAKRHNSSIARATFRERRPGDYMVAVMSQRSPHQ